MFSRTQDEDAVTDLIVRIGSPGAGSPASGSEHCDRLSGHNNRDARVCAEHEQISIARDNDVGLSSNGQSKHGIIVGVAADRGG